MNRTTSETSDYASNDKRQTPRVDHLMLTEARQDGTAPQVAHSLDFSLSGVRLSLRQPVAADRPLNLSLLLPVEEIGQPTRIEPLDVQARIVWQRNEAGVFSCGAEFLGLTESQKRRLSEAFSLAKKLLATSIAGLMLQSAPALAATNSSSTPDAVITIGGTGLSADIQASQRAVNAATASLQANLGKALQDVMNLQKNSAGNNSAALNLMYQASLTANVAKLSADGVALKSATEKLKALTASTITANNNALRAATASYEQALKGGNSASIASAKAAMDQAAGKANAYISSVFGSLAPGVTDKVQNSLGKLANNAVNLGKGLLTKNNTLVESSKAALSGNLTELATNYIEMTQPKPAPTASGGSTAPAKPSVQDTVASVVQSLDKIMIKQADGKSVSASTMINSYLSGLLKSPTAMAALSALPGKLFAAPKTAKLMDGTEFAYMDAEVTNPADTLGIFAANPETAQDKRIGYAMLTDKHGTTTALGYGQSAQYSHAKALYGDDDLARSSSEMGVANLSNAAKGGGMFAYGTRIGEDTRVAVSWSSTAQPGNQAGLVTNPGISSAKGSSLNVGVSHRVDENLTLGANVGVLNENHSLFGNAYDPNAALNMGESNRTVSLGLAAAVNLSEDNKLLAEANFAKTQGGNASGLIADTSDIQSRSWGMSLMSKNVLSKGDKLSASIIKPLRVSSGQVAIALEGTDATGATVRSTQWVGITPDGSETNYRLAYDTQLKANQKLSVQATIRKDAQNIAGNNEAAVGVSWNMKF